MIMVVNKMLVLAVVTCSIPFRVIGLSSWPHDVRMLHLSDRWTIARSLASRGYMLLQELEMNS